MPTMQRLAENGLTYTQWHTTALCSPTRSCILTGRNHHQTGFACIVEGATGYPGSNAHLPRETATIAQVLRGNGWNTYWVGKDHNVPPEEDNPGGPKSNWPLQQGFDRFYGFLGGETNQWYPTLVEDNHAIEQPYLPEEGYHFSKDIADQALRMLRDSQSVGALAPVVHVALPRRQPRAAPRRPVSGPTSTRASSTTATRRTASGCSRA